MFNDVVCRPDFTVAVEQAEELYRSLIKDTRGNCQNTWKVETYIQKLYFSDDHFNYEIASDADLGSTIMIVWKTGTIRADFWIIWLCSTLGLKSLLCP